MGNKVLIAWYICDTCKKHIHGFEFDILENGARDDNCDECKKTRLLINTDNKGE